MEEVGEGNGGRQGKFMIFSRKQSCSNFTKKTLGLIRTVC